ncbi:MAG: glycosyltransferase family 2 protein [Bacteroidales bacterium]|nr:glycosyltransferase family 2 protein [Bacteroidales bacterium]MBQ6081463.1 glycosyltransferase family 2 protein [Bacteroidales bacterium]
MTRISCFIATADKSTVQELKANPLVGEVFCREELRSTDAVKWIAANAKGEYTLIYNKPTRLVWVHHGLHRMVQIAADTDAVLAYADRFNQGADGQVQEAPVIDYQPGSLRDDFDFGSVILIRTAALKQAVDDMSRPYPCEEYVRVGNRRDEPTGPERSIFGAAEGGYKYAGFYDLRLRLSRLGKIVHINEFLYYDIEMDTREFGEKLFDYVNPRNREVQIEMEQACTAHLKAIGGYLAPKDFKEIDLNSEQFEFEASVVIPCRNRARTIADAVKSALHQKTSFKYNVIVVDDNSTDGAAEIIAQLAAENPDKLVYIAQDKTYHAIGGNWNAALHHPKCGRFALQLDSDDVYSGPDTVQKFVEAFYAQNCAMVIGSYQITDIALKPADMAPIEHREWTPDNGRNNALRINGLGAPRGFYTPLVREMTFPTTKYGEDYAVALRISRHYRIGRIYDVMYFCRRWEGNSDASLDVATANRYNTYKDRIRTWELQARISENSAR